MAKVPVLNDTPVSELWITGRYLSSSSWEFVGVYDCEEKAVYACTQKKGLCFVGPAILNATLPEYVAEWKYGYYPKDGKIRRE